MNPDNIFTQTIKASFLHSKQVELDVLRLDAIDEIVSGNKWFKLKYYLQHAINTGCHTIATFGGAFSNHIVATAAACKQAGLHSVGFIRGEAPQRPSPTLLQAHRLGMQLVYTSREAYRHKEALVHQHRQPGWYIVNEGGYGRLGAMGAADILQYAGEDYTHIVVSVGTGTMLAGLVLGALPHQQVVGISALKGADNLAHAVNDLLSVDGPQHRFTILHQYHFGGYAKHPAPLIEFMQQVWQQFQLPLDIVYTGKLFYAITDLINQQYFAPGSRLLMVHSGGLQGNRSLAANQLQFT